ncbi:formate dehydrogenase family accessory protein FdhD [bacterium Unc6]|nr:formate dehydrogenase family accessory protein FdhD [bacterium Unc6]MBT9130720.1 Sulfurtransferase FdhD [Candidatus Psychracetigena formicireducens]
MTGALVLWCSDVNMEEVWINKIDKGERRVVKDVVTEEIPLTIYYNGKELATLLCSPNKLKELVVGFLYSLGLIAGNNEIKQLTTDDKRWTAAVATKRKNNRGEEIFKRVFTSGCGKGTILYSADAVDRKRLDSKLRINHEKISQIMVQFHRSSISFQRTGGVHSAALTTGENIEIFMEDIGRHNALDKVIGEALLKNFKMKNSIMLTSGRLSSEIVLKAIRCDIPVLVTRSAPTDQAVKIARERNLTLVGFVRGKRMNIYAGEERITL